MRVTALFHPRPVGSGAGFRARMLPCLLLGWFVGLTAARNTLAGPAPVGPESGALILIWKSAPPEAVIRPGSGAAPAGLRPEALGLGGAGLRGLRPLFAGHTAASDPLARFWVAEPAPGVDPVGVAATLARDARIASVEAGGVWPLESALPDDPFFAHADPDSAQWPLHGNPTGPDMHAIDAWNVTPGDTSAIVAVIDSGVDWHHPEFGGAPGPDSNIQVNWRELNGQPGVDDDQNGFVDDVRGWDFVDVSLISGESNRVAQLDDGFTPDNDPDDYDGHGTFVSGIIAARADDGRGMAGAAPGCRVMPLRAGWRQDYFDNNSGAHVVRGVISEMFCAQAIVYAADNGARVMNCSWFNDSTAVLKAAVDYAVGQKGVVAVVAAGNTGGSENQRFNYLSRRGDCIDVAAVDRNGFIHFVSAIGTWVDVSAPGAEILSLASASFGRHYTLYPGGATSWAAPFAAAAAALVVSAAPWLDPAGVRARLRETATSLDAQHPPAFAGKIGAGMVNMAAALHAGLVNPTVQLASAPATPPAWLGDGRAAFTTASGRLARVDPYTGAADSVDLPISGPIGGVAYRAVDNSLVVTFGRGQVARLDVNGAAVPGWPRPIGGLAPAAPVAGPDAAALFVAGTDSLLYAWTAGGGAVPGFPARLPDGAVSPPALGDLDGDGALDLVVVCRDGSIAAFDSRTGAAKPGWPVPATPATGLLPPLLGDLDGDGRLDVIVPDPSGRLDAFGPTGLHRAGWPRLAGAPLVGEPALADLDGNGRAVVIVALADRHVAVFEGDGAPRPGWPVALKDDAAAGPIAGSVDGTEGPSRRQIVVATRGGCLVALQGRGRPVAGWPKRLDGTLDSPPAILIGGGPRPAWCVAIDTSGRLWQFSIPSFLDAPGGAAWSTFAGDPGHTRALRATAPLAPGPDPEPRAPALAFAPNPFRSQGASVTLTLPRAGRVQARILDVQGRVVRRLLDEVRPGGGLVLTWDGRDEAGREAPAGVYLYRIDLPGARAQGRLVRVR